jgi:hypothetical protein
VKAKAPLPSTEVEVEESDSEEEVSYHPLREPMCVPIVEEPLV